jgi:hypothetical protein
VILTLITVSGALSVIDVKITRGLRCGRTSSTARSVRDAAAMRTGRIPEELRDVPFTTAQAKVYGVTRSVLQGSQWRHVFRDVWVHCKVPDTREMRLEAVRLVLRDGAFVCGLTAAWICGIEAQDRRGDLVWVGCRTGSRLRTRTGCLTREITVDDSDLQVVNGITLTTRLRTIFDCARWLPLVEGVVVADAIAHDGAVSPDDLASYAAVRRGLRGIRRLDQVLDLMDPLSESPMETRVRLLLVLAGLPRPTSQLIVRDARGLFVARVDFAYEEQRLIVEYDGALHWEQRRADDRRRDALRAVGWTVLVFGRADYYDNPHVIVATVARALARRAA